jgi:hypothetical protein
MPNRLNFAFDMGLVVTVAPFLYLAFFPQIYYYLIVQRKKYFRELRQQG